MTTPSVSSSPDYLPIGSYSSAETGASQNAQRRVTARVGLTAGSRRSAWETLGVRGVLELAVAISVSLTVLWILLLVVLVVARPRGMDLDEAKRFVPDVVRLVRRLARDPNVSKGVRRRLLLLLAYLASPLDLVPDFIPVVGYADDVIAVAIVLRSVVRSAGRGALEAHWSGSPKGLALVQQLAGIGEP